MRLLHNGVHAGEILGVRKERKELIKGENQTLIVKSVESSRTCMMSRSDGHTRLHAAPIDRR